MSSRRGGYQRIWDDQSSYKAATAELLQVTERILESWEVEVTPIKHTWNVARSWWSLSGPDYVLGRGDEWLRWSSLKLALNNAQHGNFAEWELIGVSQMIDNSGWKTIYEVRRVKRKWNFWTLLLGRGRRVGKDEEAASREIGIVAEGSIARGTDPKALDG
jgi:hypothetical protein